MAKKKSPLDKKFVDEMKQILEEEKARLEKELSVFTTKNPHVKDDYDASYPEYGDKNDENAQEVERYTVRKPLEIALEKNLRDVKNALKRIEDGVYGICKYCNEAIEKKRLQARPTSSACVSCKKTLTNEV